LQSIVMRGLLHVRAKCQAAARRNRRCIAT
jgi:hypothetical protein